MKIKAKVRCDFCQDRKIVCSDDAEMMLVQITPLPKINLTTGETYPAEEPFYALEVKDDYGVEYFDYVKFCPFCGRML